MSKEERHEEIMRETIEVVRRIYESREILYPSLPPFHLVEAGLAEMLCVMYRAGLGCERTRCSLIIDDLLREAEQLTTALREANQKITLYGKN